MTTQALMQGSDAGRWDQSIYAFLAEKHGNGLSGRKPSAVTINARILPEFILLRFRHLRNQPV